MREGRASKSFAGEANPRAVFKGPPARSRSGGPLVWLNLVCLDAPVVAVSWQWLFANTFEVPLLVENSVALFLTAWLIYLADRFGDSLSLPRHSAISLRQKFCVRHRVAWLVFMGVLAVADVLIIASRLDRGTIFRGAVAGALALVYLFLNRAAPFLWRALPLKEISIGLLFATGTVISISHGLTSAMFTAWLLFAILCSLNCISIAVWERALDVAQRRISIATAFPKISSVLVPALGLLFTVSLVSAGIAPRGRGIHFCIAASALLLGALHVCRDTIEPDTRTALADLVLLTPVAAFVFGWR